jgi:tetratricopeptide (TPR) repeat protein
VDIVEVVGAAAGVIAIPVSVWLGVRREPSAPAPDPTDWSKRGRPTRVPVEYLPEYVRGRQDLLEQLRQQRRSGGLAVVVGAGGMGKSTLARELVRRIQQDARGRKLPPVWEVPGASVEDLVDGLVTVAHTLGATQDDMEAIATKMPAGPDRLWQLLEAGPRGWLLIIDNADDPRVLAVPGSGDPPRMADGWARTSERGLVLITSRQRKRTFWPPTASLYPIDGLDVREAGRVLRDHAPEAGDLAQAMALGQRLGGLPLALYLAGRYLGSEYVSGASFDGYRRRLDSDVRAIGLLDDPEAMDRALVTVTWELSLDALRDRGLPQARPLLRLLSCYAPVLPIPLALLDPDLLRSFFSSVRSKQARAARVEPRLDQVLAGLDGLGLIDRAPASAGANPAPSAIVVHPVIADTNRFYLERPRKHDPPPERVRQTAVDLLAAEIDRLEDSVPRDWPDFRVVTPHLQALVNHAAELDERDLGVLLRAAGQTAMAYGQMLAADIGIDLIEGALAACAGRPAVTQTEPFLIARQQHAHLLGTGGRHADAEDIYRAVLEAQRRFWPDDDQPANLAVRHCCAHVIGLQGREEEARDLFDELLAVEKRVLGEDHYITRATRTELAALLYRQGEWPRAEAAFRGILEDEQRLSGEHGCATLATRHNLAHAIRRQSGHLEEGEQEFRSLLAEEENSLGDEHLTTKATKSYRQGGLLYAIVLSTPDLRQAIAQDLYDRAAGLDRDGRPDEAAEAFLRLANRFGQDPSARLRELALNALSYAADVLEKAGRVPDELMARRRLTELNAGIPAEERSAADGIRARFTYPVAMKALKRGLDLASQGAVAESEGVYEQVIDDYGDDPDYSIRELAAMALFNQAVGMDRQGRIEDAIVTYGLLADRYADDPYTEIRLCAAAALTRRAEHLRSAGLAEEALAAIERALALYEAIPGHEADEVARARRAFTAIKPAAARAMLALGRALAEQGYVDEAIPVLTRADRIADGPDGVRVRELLTPLVREKAGLLYHQCLALRQEDNVQGALDTCTQLIELCSDRSLPELRKYCAEALLEKGNALTQLDRPAEAAAAYQELVGRYHADEDHSLRALVAMANFNLSRNAA